MLTANPSKKSQAHVSHSHLSGTCKLFVGNLATQTTGAHLQSIFHSYGHVIECVKVRERYGFVRFSTSEESQRALTACNGLQLNGYPMIVEYAQNEILISPKSPRSQSFAARAYPSKPVATPIAPQRMSFAQRAVNVKNYFSSSLNPDASSFTFACSTSDYYSQSDRPSSRSSSILPMTLPLSCSDDDDDEENDDDDDESCRHSNDESSRSSLNIFIGDKILNLYGSNLDICKHFNGRDIDPRDPIFIWNFAFYPDVSINPFVKRTDIKTLLERRVSLYSQ